MKNNTRKEYMLNGRRYFLMEMKHDNLIVNSKALDRLGIKKSYGFMKIDDYILFKEKCTSILEKNEQICVGVYGIYGDYDLVFVSHERNPPPPEQRLKHRFWSIFGDEDYFATDRFRWAEIEDTIKHRGLILSGSKSQVVEPLFELEKYLPFLRRVMSNEQVEEEIVKELKSKNLCLEVDYSLSDVGPDEETFQEFMVLVSLSKERETQKESPIDIFEKEIMKKYLLNDNRVRTIEKIGSRSSIEGNYILHIVGHIDDLSDIVLSRIHTIAHETKGLKVKTTMNLMAEKIADNKVPGLLECSVSEIHALILSEMISKYRTLVKPQKFTFPFAIFYIDEYDREALRETYEIYTNLIHRFYEKDEDLMNSMIKFIFKVAELMATTGDRQIRSCKEFDAGEGSAFVRIVSNQIEGSLQQVFHYCAKKNGFSDKEFNKLINWAIETKLGEKGLFDLKKLNLGPATYAIRSLEGLFGEKASLRKKKKKHLVDADKMKKLERIHQIAKNFFEPKTEEYKKRIGMRQTITNLNMFSSNARNILQHEQAAGERTKGLQFICQNIGKIVKGVYHGVRYLRHVSAQMEIATREEKEIEFHETYKYDVALSFAGEDRHHAMRLADCLKKHGVRVFYDEYEQADLWGKNLYDHLAWVYKDAAQYCAMFISESYARKLWTNHERKNAQARAFRELEEYILPIRLDDTDIPGLPETVAHIDLRNISIKKVCKLLLEKLGMGMI